MIEEIEALRIGPDEVLILNVRNVPSVEIGMELTQGLMEAIKAVGLESRAFVLVSDDIEMTIVDRGAPCTRPPRPGEYADPQPVAVDVAGTPAGG